MDNLAIFSVKHDCVKQKMNSFDVPAKMPQCTGDKCICAWFWLANRVRPFSLDVLTTRMRR